MSALLSWVCFPVAGATARMVCPVTSTSILIGIK
uniref:Uncharacterized protein n=1 Tax=Setaria viridis TaxID=4556 RepID=A0A4U6TMJ6_SETVI|nr:hypothetical protein SEVIR_8G246852v2 [Setaria viridis]